jgi:hypothetical protein
LHRCGKSSGVWEGVGFKEMKSLRHDCAKVELDVAEEDLKMVSIGSRQVTVVELDR